MLLGLGAAFLVATGLLDGIDAAEEADRTWLGVPVVDGGRVGRSREGVAGGGLGVAVAGRLPITDEGREGTRRGLGWATLTLDAGREIVGPVEFRSPLLPVTELDELDRVSPGAFGLPVGLTSKRDRFDMVSELIKIIFFFPERRWCQDLVLNEVLTCK